MKVFPHVKKRELKKIKQNLEYDFMSRYTIIKSVFSLGDIESSCKKTVSL